MYMTGTNINRDNQAVSPHKTQQSRLVFIVFYWNQSFDISYITQDTVFLSLTELIFDIVYIVPVVENNLLAFCVLSRLAFWFSPFVVFLESCLDWPFVISIDICLHVLSRPTSWVSFLIVYSVVSCVDWQLGYLCWYSSQSYTYFVEIDRCVITIDRLPGGLSRLTFGYFYW
jgi:hypothetical protein